VKLKLLTTFLGGVLVYAQYSPSRSGSSTAAAEINSKPAWQTSTNACIGLNGTVGKDFCTDTSTGLTYTPTTTGTPATWGVVQGLAIQSGGTPLGRATTVNVVSGTGVICIPQVNSSVLTFQCNADTSYLVSKPNIQSGTSPQICTSSSNNGAGYTASCASTLNAYAAKQTLFWFADVANTSTTPTLNIDTLGALTLVRETGAALKLNDLTANTLYRIWYDGTNIRVVEAGVTYN